MAARDRKTTTTDGLPREVFAIPGDATAPDTWRLPHHKKSIIRALKMGTALEKTVDWDLMPAAVAALSPAGRRGRALDVSPEETLVAARHLADHYRAVGKPLPDILAALA